MLVLKMIISDLPDYPMYVKSDIKALHFAIDNMLDGHPVLDPPPFTSEPITLSITPEEMTEVEFAALKEWEP